MDWEAKLGYLAMYAPVSGENNAPSLSSDSSQNIPQVATCPWVHSCSWLILKECIYDNRYVVFGNKSVFHPSITNFSYTHSCKNTNTVSNLMMGFTKLET